jgi:hypothetical protein
MEHSNDGTSIFDHMNGKTKSKKMKPRNALIKEEDAIVITWTLVMGGCGCP